MRRQVLAVATALTCSAIFLAGPAVLVSGRADDGSAKGKAPGADLFGLTKVVGLHIEISADEYQAMQPPPPAAFGAPPPAPRPKRPGERESERNLFGVEFSWARGRDRGGQDLQGRGYPLFGERFLLCVRGWP